jgi:hypothetical protein
MHTKSTTLNVIIHCSAPLFRSSLHVWCLNSFHLLANLIPAFSTMLEHHHYGCPFHQPTLRIDYFLELSNVSTLYGYFILPLLINALHPVITVK